MIVALLVIVAAIVIFGLGAVIEGALWLLAVGAIVLIAGVALIIGQLRTRG